MTRRPRWRRRLAHALLWTSRRLLPAAESTWADAMAAECACIDCDRQALGWAWGSLRAGMSQRLRWLCRRAAPSTHALGVCWIVVFVVSSSYNVTLIVATRMHRDATVGLLGRFLDDFHYDRFTTLSQAIPLTLIIVMGAVVALYACALYLSIRRQPAALPTFCAAMTLSLASWLYELSLPAYHAAMTTPHRWRIGLCFALTAAVLAILHLLPDSDTPDPPRSSP